jgi:hypothetical protein
LARARIVAGDPAGALRALDGYDKAFPRGVLAPEAAALRMDAYTSSGDLAATRRAARSYLARFPEGGAAERARRALETPGP